MPKKLKIIYSGFDGNKKTYNSLSTACEELGLKYHSLLVKFQRQEKQGKDRVYVWIGGKIEAIDE